MTENQPIIVSANEYKARQIAESKMQASTAQIDFAPEGGRYLVGGEWVDADGQLTSAPKGAGDAVKAFENEQKIAAEENAERERQRVAGGVYGRDVTAEAQAEADAVKAAQKRR